MFQQQACKLLCVASCNYEADVVAVIERHLAMLLKTDDITTIQMHWGLKSDSIATLADDLGLGLDSFVFIDDDKMQCAEVNRLEAALAGRCLTGRTMLSAYLATGLNTDHIGRATPNRSLS